MNYGDYARYYSNFCSNRKNLKRFYLVLLYVIIKFNNNVKHRDKRFCHKMSNNKKSDTIFGTQRSWVQIPSRR